MMFLVSVAVLGYLAVGVAAQTFKFTVPSRANDRAKVDNATNPQGIVTTILHPNLGVGAYTVSVNYYVPGCTGGPLTSLTGMDYDVSTEQDVGGLYLSRVTNPLAAIRALTANNFYVDIPFTAPATVSPGKYYQFCVEYVLKMSETVLDQERYNVKLPANTDGAVSTNAVVITDLNTDADATTFTARAYICTATGTAAAPNVVYTPVNPNFFQGDTVTICFESVNYPEASITGFDTATNGGLALVDGSTPPYNIIPGSSLTNLPSIQVANNECIVTSGKQRCAVQVTLTGAGADAIFTGVPTATSAKTLVINGKLTMRFGTARRNVRVLLQAGDTFPRNTNTTLTIVGGTSDKNDSGCSACSEWFFLFKIICWIFKCLLGFS